MTQRGAVGLALKVQDQRAGVPCSNSLRQRGVAHLAWTQQNDSGRLGQSARNQSLEMSTNRQCILIGHRSKCNEVIKALLTVGAVTHGLAASLLQTFPVRLSTSHRLALKLHFARELGADCEVLLFGSRVDDALRGGDADLLVRSPRVLQHHTWLAARLASRAERLLDGRRVDVLLLDPSTDVQPVHAAALATGVAL